MSEMDELRKFIKDEFTNTNSIVESVEKKVCDIVKQVDHNNTRINKLEDYSAADNHRLDKLEYQIELMNQDRLRNNLRLTGLPPAAFERVESAVMQIINVLKLNLVPSEFTAYADQSKYSIIVSFDHQTHKRLFMNALRQRKTLLVEEVFPSTQSNSKIYCNDQLTPYFSKLFQSAWQAKREKQIHSASSTGGRIKIRKNENSKLITVESIQHLTEIIADTSDSSTMETSNANSNGSPRSSQPQQINQNSKNTEASSPAANISHNSAPPPNRDRNSAPHQTTNFRSHSRYPTSNATAPNRENQWNQLHSKHNGRSNHNIKPNYRRQHQDHRRDISISPNQNQPPHKFAGANRSESYQTGRYRHRNYSSHETNHHF